MIFYKTLWYTVHVTQSQWEKLTWVLFHSTNIRAQSDVPTCLVRDF